MMDTAKKQSKYWWFNSHSNSNGRSQWLQSTLSELEERTKSMLKIIEEDADSFAQRADMYYEKRPQLVTLVEDFYRIHRSLAIQFDHSRHNNPSTRRTSPLLRSFSLSTVESEKKPMDPKKTYAYDYLDSDEDSVGSEVDDDTIPMCEIERLKEEATVQERRLMEKEREMEELRKKLYETQNEVIELKEEAETMRMNLVEENESLKRMLEEKDEEKREVIRQLSVAIELLKSENLSLKFFANERLKKWNPFDFQAFKGFRKKVLNCSIVPL